MKFCKILPVEISHFKVYSWASKAITEWALPCFFFREIGETILNRQQEHFAKVIEGISQKKNIYIYIYKTLGLTMGGGSRLKKLIRKYKTAHKKENNDVKYLSHTLHFSVTLVQV